MENRKCAYLMMLSLFGPCSGYRSNASICAGRAEEAHSAPRSKHHPICSRFDVCAPVPYREIEFSHYYAIGFNRCNQFGSI